MSLKSPRTNVSKKAIVLITKDFLLNTPFSAASVLCWVTSRGLPTLSSGGHLLPQLLVSLGSVATAASL